MRNELVYTLKSWRLVHLLGITTLRTRYARSKFGQAWLTLTTSVQIFSAALVWTLIWKMKLDEYLPYIGVGHIIFMLFSTTINESSGAIIADARFYLNDKQPFIISVAAHIYRNIIVFIHNIPVIFILVIWSSFAKFEITLLFLMGLFVSVLFLFYSCYFVAMICTRFRDVIQIVGIIFQMAFLLTPVMWKVEFIPVEFRNYIFLNPLASILELIRNPIIGLPVNELAMYSIILWTLIVFLLCKFVHSFLGKKLIFWI